jgi:Xaa-Pro aminopeptidase
MLKAEMKKEGVEGVASFRQENIRFISDLRPVWGEYLGMTTRYCCTMGVEDDTPELFVGNGEVERVRDELDWLGRQAIRPMPQIESESDLETFFAKGLVPFVDRHRNGGKIALDIVSVSLINKLRSRFPKTSFVDGDFFLKQAKMLKNPEEIKLLRGAAAVADAGITEAISQLRPGIRECELVGHAYRVMQSMGMERPQVASICASGERTVPLHRMSTGRIVQHGDMVFMDMGACYRGYFSDQTRTVPVGRVTEKVKDVYQGVYSALTSAIAKLRPGTPTAEVSNAARNAIKEAGYEEYGYYGLLGHGIGTSGQEAPLVGEIVATGEQKAVLQAGMCFTLEPGIFLPDVTGIRLEDNVLITESGADVLTRVPYAEELL